MADIQDTLKEKFNSLLESANSLRQSATESLKETFESGKEKSAAFSDDTSFFFLSYMYYSVGF